MSTTSKRVITLLFLVPTLAMSSAAWSAKLEGDYLGMEDSFFEKLSFRPGGQVRVTFMDMTKVGTFELEGKEVLITIGNETNVFTIDAQGCVVGGGFIGTYCKDGVASKGADKTAKGTAPAGTGKEAGLSGRYQAGNAAASIALDFKTDGQVRITLSGTQAQSESMDATYKMAGDQVTISPTDGSPPLVLTRKGNVLEGAPEGESMKMKFVKQ